MLPFLKSNNGSESPREEKSIGGNANERLEDHCIDELMSAVESKNVMSFRSAIEALVLNCFEDGGSHG